MKRITVFLLIIVAILSITIFATAEKVVTFGNILPLTGTAAPVGIEGRHAREMAIEEINAAGGIKSMGGAKIEMIYRDSKGNPEVGVSETERLITVDKVKIITGTFQSGVAYPSTAVAERYGVLFFCPVPSEPRITERGFKYVFRLAEKTSWRVRDEVRFLVDVANKKGISVKKAGVVYENTAYGLGAKDALDEYLAEANISIALDQPFASGLPDALPIVDSIRNANLDVLFYIGYSNDTILLINSLAEQKVNLKAFFGVGNMQEPLILENLGSKLEYVIDVAPWVPDINRPGAKEINQKYKDKYGNNMSPEAMKAYVGMYILKEALEIARTDDPDVLTKVLRDTKFTGWPYEAYQDSVDFDENGQAQVQLVMLQDLNIDGKIEYTTVYPEHVAREGIHYIFPMVPWEDR